MVFVKDLTLIGPHSSYIFFKFDCVCFSWSIVYCTKAFLFLHNTEIRRLSCRISSSNSISHLGCFHVPLRVSMQVISVLKGFIPLTIIHPMTAEYTIQFKIHNADQGFEWLLTRLSSIIFSHTLSISSTSFCVGNFFVLVEYILLDISPSSLHISRKTVCMFP